MFDRPPVSDDRLLEATRAAYGVTSFAPEPSAGQDAAAWSYHARLESGDEAFVKVSGRFDEGRLTACRWLFENGLEEVVAPIRTRSGALSVRVGDVEIVAYPLVDGRPAAEAGLTADQWVAYGHVLARLHAASLPAAVAARLPRESFLPVSLDALERARAAVAAVGRDLPDDGVAREVRALWRRHLREIDLVAAKTRDLGALLRQRLSDDADAETLYVACHGDVHTYNVLVAGDGRLRVVDWDELLIAPPERDLMFIVGSPIGLPRGEREIALFTRGYGGMPIVPARLAYYHAEWAVQDVAGYTERALSRTLGADSRASALSILHGLFDAGGEVEIARTAPSE